MVFFGSKKYIMNYTKFIATYLDVLKVKNPTIFAIVGILAAAGVAAAGYFGWADSHPAISMVIFTVSSYFNLRSTSTFGDLPEDHPKKVAVQDEVNKQIHEAVVDALNREPEKRTAAKEALKKVIKGSK